MSEHYTVRRFLLTAPMENILKFHLLVRGYTILIENRGATLHYACGADDSERFIRAAIESDITVQEIITNHKKNARHVDLGGGASVEISDNIEEDLLLYMGSHQMQWERKEQAS